MNKPPVSLPPLRQRKKIRLEGWDYRRTGAYFITICTYHHQCTFGQISHGLMKLNDWGQIVVRTWRQIPHHAPHVSLDQFICMPNHVHGIIWLHSDDDNLPPPPTHGVASGSLGAVVGSFKSAITGQINLLRGATKPRIWQPRFFDRIIRNEAELEAIRRYIANNPLNWENERNGDRDHAQGDGLPYPDNL